MSRLDPMQKGPPTPSRLTKNNRFAYISILTLDPWGQGQLQFYTANSKASTLLSNRIADGLKEAMDWYVNDLTPEQS
jgi:hypothetical protein